MCVLVTKMLLLINEDVALKMPHEAVHCSNTVSYNLGPLLESGIE